MAEAKLLRGKLAAQGVHLHIIAPLPGESIDKAVFGTMAKCDAFLAMATKDYGANTGNTASTYHEERTWRKEYQPKGKPLIPLRMVRASTHFHFIICRITRSALLAQIPWGDEFEHEMARELFGSNLLALKWIKGEAMPGELVDDILRGLGLERETEEQRRQRVSNRKANTAK